MKNETTLNEMKLQELEKKFHEENNKMIGENQSVISDLIRRIQALKNLLNKQV